MSLNGLLTALAKDPAFERIRVSAERGPDAEDEKEIAAPDGLRPPLVAQIAQALPQPAGGAGGARAVTVVVLSLIHI